MCDPLPTRLEQLHEELVAAVTLGDIEREARVEAEMKEIDARAPNLGKAALRIAEQLGWEVFPLLPRGERLRSGAISDGKKPATSHGFYDASADPCQIRYWWGRWPAANIGVPTGVWFDVVDVDSPKPDRPAPGAIAYNQLLEAGLVPDSHAMVSTASGGLHVYIEPTGEGSTTNFVPSVDYRGRGGYCVVPPSVVGAGRWSWLNVPSPVIRGI
jgi:Bifunctional DNA primase/polymerase, N-terminal